MIQESSQIAKEIISWEIWSNVFLSIIFLSLSVFFFYVAIGSSKKMSEENNTVKKEEDSLRVIGFSTIVAIIFSVIFFTFFYDAIKAEVAPNLILQKHHIVTEQKNDKS